MSVIIPALLLSSQLVKQRKLSILSWSYSNITCEYICHLNTFLSIIESYDIMILPEPTNLGKLEVRFIPFFILHSNRPSPEL